MYDVNRYARQMALPEVGSAGQDRLRRAQVLLVGAGGLGCPVLQYLVGAGVGQITLIDPDHVEESNLHRQPLYRMSDVGRPKVEAACGHLRAANPEVRLIPISGALHPGNAENLTCEADLVIDAADSFAVSYILSDTCLKHEKPLISASALGQAGYIAGFCGGAPSLRAVFPDLPARGATCNSAGVLGPVVGTIGALEAQIALQVLLAQDPLPLGRMVTLDLKTLSFGGFDFRDAAEPDINLPFLSLCDLSGEDQVIELRGEEEAPKPITPTAIRCLPENISSLEPVPDRRVVLCCASGLRAWHAAKRLEERGHASLAILAQCASA